MSDLLIEIFTEELPARFINGAEAQFVEHVVAHLDELFITHGEAHEYATPRRLIAYIADVAEQTEPRTDEVKGPAKAVSYDAQGNPTQALLGFCRGHSVDPTQVYTAETAGKTYVYVRQTVPGQQSHELIETFLPRLIHEISFPKMMHWEESGLQFARPIRALTALLGTRVLHWEVAGVCGSNITFGLRVGKPKPITVTSPDDYFRRLREAFVIVDPAERRKLIEKQAEKLLKPMGLKLGENAAGLMDEVVNLVEYPTAFVGNLPDIAAQLPESVVRSVLQQQMHSFLVYDQNNKFVSHFLSVRNGLTDFIDIVRRGNENVANARLLDAAFFMQEDTRKPLDAYLPQLDTLVFMDKLGTMKAKTDRIEELAAHATDFSQLKETEQNTLVKAAHLAKADLSTNMVKEYTELQGEIGSVYLQRTGSSDDVAAAIREQYMPRSAAENVASTQAGRLLGIIDKVDTLAGILGTGFNPSGSEDPYGLRRAGNGIIRTILEARERIDLVRLVHESIETYHTANILEETGNLEEKVIDYLKGRILQYFKEKQLIHEFEPLEDLPLLELNTVSERMHALREVADDAALITLSDSHRRIQNITKGHPAVAELPGDLSLTEPEEIALLEATGKAAPIIGADVACGDYTDAIRACEKLAAPITTFFDRILVMATDEHVRSARLLLLCRLKYILGSVCDYSKLT